MRPGFFWFLCLDKSPAYKVKPDGIVVFWPMHPGLGEFLFRRVWVRAARLEEPLNSR